MATFTGTPGNDALSGTTDADSMSGGPGNDSYVVDNSGDVITELPGEGWDAAYASVTYVLAAGSEIEGLATLNASSTTALNLTGNEIANYLVGNAGSNAIDGGGSNDTMEGLGGNDFYVVDTAGDVVIEAAGGGGFDAVYTSVSYTLTAGQEVEGLGTLNPAATTTINLTGNGIANYIVGNAGVNTIDGGTGADTMEGLGGNDNYVVDNVNDRILEAVGGGFDAVYSSISYTLAAGQQIEGLAALIPSGITGIDLNGNEIANYIVGNAGTNVIDGGVAADTLEGLGGNDYYVIDNAGDRTIEAVGGGGFDAAYTSVSYALTAGQEIEGLATLSPAATTALNLTGNAINNYIVGNAGINTIDGGAGNDTLEGGGGNDNYIVDSAGDMVLEAVGGGGFDTVYTLVSYTLTAGQEIEGLATLSPAATTAINLTGNAINNYIVGNAGSNALDGGAGNDVLEGLAGNDSYIVDSGADRVVELAGGGWDAVYTSVSYALAADSDVEGLATASPSGTAAINLTGNDLANYIVGNAGANILNGLGGSDALEGGAGNDEFHFTTALGAGNIDQIVDYAYEFDEIVLGGEAGQPFAALATGDLDAGAYRSSDTGAAVDADDRIIFNYVTGALFYDADGNGSGAAVQFATLAPRTPLWHHSFTVSGPANQPTVITSGTTATIAENSPVSTIVYQIAASDPDGDSIAYFLGGADASLFTIDAGGAVRLVTPADYETRVSYSLVVTASDSAGAGSSRSVTINVTDVADTPTGGPTPIINETSAINNAISQAQSIDRGLLRASDNFNLFNDDLPSATIRGTIATGSPNADIDYFSITLNAGERLILDIDNTVGSLDALVRVYDAAGNQLGFVDDSPVDPGSETDRAGTTLDSFLAFRAPTTGTYYFSVESWGEGSDDGPGTGTTTGSYDLHVSIGPPVSAQEAISEDIQALIGSNGWPDPNPGLPGINLTYAFPNSPSDYPANTRETQSNFEQFNAVQQAATTTMLQQIAGVANLTFAQLFDPNESGATLRFAMSDEPEVAYAYLPGGGLGGTAWFRNSPIGSRSTPSFDNPVPGGYAWMSIAHESGHALGLKHGHEFPAISFERDSTEYTIMTYRSYVGQAPNGYTNETWGFPSTPMMLDIGALQRMYGANFSFNSGDSVYSWSTTTGQSFVNGAGGPLPGGNRVFMTIWDGGGNDTYDLSNYGNNVTIDLRPGEWTLTSPVQIANLGQGHMARGNVGNAYLFNGDTRSLIENGIGGSGNDTLVANQAANRLTGGAGNDSFRWHSVENAGLGALADIVTDFVRGADRIDLSQIDAILGTSNDDSFSFIGTSAFSQVAGQLRYQVEGNAVRIQGDVDGNGVADMEIVLNNVTSLDGNDFFF